MLVTVKFKLTKTMEEKLADAFRQYGAPAVYLTMPTDIGVGFATETTSFTEDGGVHHFICPICLLIPKVPFCLNCGHVLCDYCFLRLARQGNLSISDLLSQPMKCPICRAHCNPILTKPLGEWDALPARLFACIKVSCENAGCTFKASPHDMEYHQAFRCTLRRILCPNIGCQLQASAADIQKHLPTCPYLRINHTCGIALRAEDVATHNCVGDLNRFAKISMKAYQQRDVAMISAVEVGKPAEPAFRPLNVSLDACHYAPVAFLQAWRTAFLALTRLHNSRIAQPLPPSPDPTEMAL